MAVKRRKKKQQEKYAVYILAKVSNKRHFKQSSFSKEKLHDLCKKLYKNIENCRKTYTGISNNFLQRRLRQHNGVIKGGAHYTRSGSWLPIFVVCGMPTLREALQLEKALKKQKTNSRKSPIARRISILWEVFSRERWSAEAPANREILPKLHVWWHQSIVSLASNEVDWSGLPSCVRPAISLDSLHRCLVEC